MSDKPKIASVRPSPLASILGIVGTIVILIFGIFFISDMQGYASVFMLRWILFGLVIIFFFLIDLISFSKFQQKDIPLTAEKVIEFDANDQEISRDFETKLRKIEALKKDGLLSDDEYKQKRKEILSQKW